MFRLYGKILETDYRSIKIINLCIGLIRRNLKLNLKQYRSILEYGWLRNRKIIIIKPNKWINFFI